MHAKMRSLGGKRWLKRYAYGEEKNGIFCLSMGRLKRGVGLEERGGQLVLERKRMFLKEKRTLRAKREKKRRRDFGLKGSILKKKKKK